MMEQDEEKTMMRIDEFEEKEQELRNMVGRCPTCDHMRELCICDNIKPNKLCPICQQDLEECSCDYTGPSEATQQLLQNVPLVEEFPTSSEKIVEQLALLNENFNKLLFALECIHLSIEKR